LIAFWQLLHPPQLIQGDQVASHQAIVVVADMTH
jgi:hypothetical protein